MKVGITLPQIGEHATKENIINYLRMQKSKALEEIINISKELALYAK